VFTDNGCERELVIVPVIDKDLKTVGALPLIVFVVPENVCVPVPNALNAEALFVKLPPKV